LLQKWDFSIVRFALITGAIMLCALCLSNPDSLVVKYNTDRYLSGTLPHYDMEILYRAGHAGVIPALEVYKHTQDEDLKDVLAWYLEDQKFQIGNIYDANRQSLESYLAQKRLADIQEQLRIEDFSTRY